MVSIDDQKLRAHLEEAGHKLRDMTDHLDDLKLAHERAGNIMRQQEDDVRAYSIGVQGLISDLKAVLQWGVADGS